ncbi:hypothetical protein OK18_15260 [Chryseobacterium gallinarum]|uniref:Uncharacterized protein n=1 Tax=Chryseobacterium gallinarum TaxID=1324352 RepID=A0A0G3M9P4_CHRGL|nr:hypothetical protein [Chryseobacterium gallinarum]AKK73782.1 hypothetical protein OK18_15260 [Chryseobacterium gallinarum]
MPEFEDGLWTRTYVDPQLLEDFRNYNDSFIGVLKRPNPAAIDADGIKFNKLINNVGFVVNATVDFTPLAMTGAKGHVPWDKLDTTPTSYTDAELRAMAFDKEAALRVEHTNSFKIGVRDYALSKLAPKEHTAGKMPVIRTTGEEFNGRKRLTYADLNRFLFEELVKLNLKDKNQFYLTLDDMHKADLVHDRANTNNYRDLEIDKNTGELKRFFNLQIFENTVTPKYNAQGILKSLGSTPAAGDQSASVFFYAPNTVYWIEAVKTLLKPMAQDTRSKDPTSELRLHCYGLCDKKQDHGFGAIISDNVTP